MDQTFLELTEDEFDDRFPLVPNHLNPHASWGDTDTGGCLFETYGAELTYVRAQDPRHIWTLMDGDGGDLYVVSGYHLVNRIGYLISVDPIPEHLSIQVHIPMERDDESEEPLP